MALPILQNWRNYFDDFNEGLGSSYERIILNNLLLKLQRDYDIRNVVEAPIFGFTGITGLNSVALNKIGCDLTLVDHNLDRIQKVRQIHKYMKQELKVISVDSYETLPFNNNSFDMAWNFSALWFVEDLNKFLHELTRISKKIILICVPNQTGLGYKWQKAHMDIPQGICFHEEFINPPVIKHIMRELNWHFAGEAFIDCPPWPDIGMSKESFLRKFLGNYTTANKPSKKQKALSIVDYYSGNDDGFPERMEKFAFLEKYAPDIFKKIWSHHKWLLFKKM